MTTKGKTYRVYYDDGNQKFYGAQNMKVLMYWLIKNDKEAMNITKIEEV